MKKSRLSSFKNNFSVSSANHPTKPKPKEQPPSPSEDFLLILNHFEASIIVGGVAQAPISQLKPVTQEQLVLEPELKKLQDTKPNDNHWSPSLQTLLEHPSASFPQRLIMGGVLFCFAMVLWSWYGHLEQIGMAQGKLVPQGETYKIEPLTLGKIAQIAIQEGDTVKAGQMLAELETDLAQQEVERLQKMVIASQLELTQQESLLDRARLEAETQEAITIAETRAQRSALAQLSEKVATNRQLLAKLRTEEQAYQSRQKLLTPVAGLAQTRLAQLQQEADSHRQRVERLQPLVEEGAISQEFLFQAQQAYLQTQQQITQSQLQKITGTDEQLFQAQQSLRDRQTRITQTQGEIAASLQETERLQAQLVQKQAQEEKIKLEAQQRIQRLELEITQLKAKIVDKENQLVTAKAKLEQRFLYAPVDGVILSLNIQNSGKVVQPGQTVAEIAPQGAPLELSAVIANQDAGFVKVGMPVKVKFDAYPYQDYGIIPGTVSSISADAEVDPKIGAVYQVKITLDQDYVTHEEQQIHFKAGQTASAEIIIRRRRIADILLEPIRKLQKDSTTI